MFLTCEICRNAADYYVVPGDYIVECNKCSAPINIPQGSSISEEKLERDVLKKGDMVRVDNREHVWHDAIALVCDQKHIFVRIELLGKKIWVPESWVKRI